MISGEIKANLDRMNHMYRDIPPELKAVLEPVVQAHGLDLVDAPLNRGQGRTHLQVVLDTPQGDGRVTLDQCAGVSREIGHGLDASDLIPAAYTLEVCSPGVDRTLGREVDFERVVGREVSLETRESVDGRRRFRGRMTAFDGKEVCIEVDGESHDIPFDRIRRAVAFFPVRRAGRANQEVNG